MNINVYNMNSFFLEDSNFFVNELKPNNIDTILENIEKFIENENVILITSGGTEVPLEKVKIRKITNCSTGRRGVLMCEYFLKRNKKVIFLHKSNTLLPFEHNLKKLCRMNNIEICNNKINLNINKKEKKELIENINNYEKFSKNIFLVAFDTIYEYGFYLISICNLLNENNKKNIFNNKIVKINNKINNYIYNEFRYILNIKKILHFIYCKFNNSNNKYIDEILNKSVKKLNCIKNNSLGYIIKTSQNWKNCFYYVYLCLNNIFNETKKYRRLHIQNVNKDNSFVLKHIKTNSIDYNEKKKKKIKNIDEKLNTNEQKFELLEQVKPLIESKKNELIDNTVKHKKDCINLDIYKKGIKENNKFNKYQKEKLNEKKKTENKYKLTLNSNLIILCASCSDFYIPYENMSDNKISSDNELFLKLHLTPKFYQIINKYFPYLKLCIFKLDTDEEMLIEKSKEKVQYTNILVANTLIDRYNYVYIFNKHKDYFMLKKSNTNTIEHDICNYICKELNFF